jgi:hypothetical protein
MTSKQARQFISHKIEILRKEGYKQDQAVAIAHDIARHEGYKVPLPDGIKSMEKSK